MKTNLAFILALLLGCSKKSAEKLEFDIVELKVNMFPERYLVVAFFRQDTAFVSTYEDVLHRSNGGNKNGKRPTYLSDIDDDDSIIAMKEVPVSNRDMSKLNEMVNALDFKSFAISKGVDGTLDGTLWTLEVKSATGYDSKISFRPPSSTSDNPYLVQLRNISEFVFGIHGKRLSDVPR